MIEELKAYSDFKATGLPWLERIPSHWNLVPNRALVRRRKQLVGRNHHRYRLLSLTKQGVIVRDVASGKGKFSSDMGTSQEVRDGDLVFCFFDVPETPRTVGLSPHHGMITGAYTVLEPLRPGVAPYFELFYRAMDDSKLLSPLYSGLRNTIPVDRFLGTKTPLPPPEEQEAIVRFLDHANRHIDQFIRAKKKLIALLNEQKQAIIHRAVTRGLDSKVALKHSGVPWLGEIPAHWNVLRSKYLFREVDSRSLRGEETHLSMSQRQGLVPSSSLTERRFMSDSYAGGKLCEAGDLVLNRLKAHLGVFALAPQAGVISPDYTVLRPMAAMALKYFEAVYRTPACRVVLRQKAKGIVQGFWRLYTDDFYDIAVPVPPVEEQEAIVDGLAQSLVGVQMALGQAEREIALMSEYRSRLVADVVTGQLDVRSVAAGLPVVEPEAASTQSEGDETDIEDGEAS